MGDMPGFIRDATLRDHVSWVLFDEVSDIHRYIGRIHEITCWLWDLLSIPPKSAAIDFQGTGQHLTVELSKLTTYTREESDLGFAVLIYSLHRDRGRSTSTTKVVL